MRYLSLFFSFFLTVGSLAQEFEVTFPSDISQVKAVVTRPEGGYYVAGRNFIESQADYDLTIGAIDEEFNTIWYKEYGSELNDDLVLVHIGGDGSVYVLSRSRGWGTELGGLDTQLLKFDAGGNFQWAKRLGDFQWTQTFDITEDVNGNLLLGGIAYIDINQRNKVFVASITPQGELNYYKIFYKFLWEYTNGMVTATSDGGCLFTTSHAIVDNYDVFDFVVTKLDPNGNVEWAKSYGTSLIEGNIFSRMSRAIEMDGNFIFAGRAFTNDPQANEYIWLQKIDSLGNIHWVKALANDSFTASHFGDMYAVPGTNELFLMAIDNSDINWKRYGVVVDSAGNVQNQYYLGDTSGTFGTYHLSPNGHAFFTGSEEDQLRFRSSPLIGSCNFEEGNLLKSFGEIDSVTVEDVSFVVFTRPTIDDLLLEDLNLRDISPEVSVKFCQDLEIDQDTISELCPGDVAHIEASGDLSYTWFELGRPDDTLSVSSELEFQISSETAFIVEGYSGSDTVYVTIGSECYAIKVFEWLSPNGDGRNEFFKIENIQYHPDHELKIFDLAGHLILQSTDYKNDWDGGNWPSGVYCYLLTVNQDVFKGTFFLNKE